MNLRSTTVGLALLTTVAMANTPKSDVPACCRKAKQAHETSATQAVGFQDVGTPAA